MRKKVYIDNLTLKCLERKLKKKLISNILTIE